MIYSSHNDNKHTQEDGERESDDGRKEKLVNFGGSKDRETMVVPEGMEQSYKRYRLLS